MKSIPWTWTEIGEKIVDRPMIVFSEKPATMTMAIATAEVMKNRSSAVARRGAAWVAKVAIFPSRRNAGRLWAVAIGRRNAPGPTPRATGFARKVRDRPAQMRRGARGQAARAPRAA